MGTCGLKVQREEARQSERWVKRTPIEALAFVEGAQTNPGDLAESLSVPPSSLLPGFPLARGQGSPMQRTQEMRRMKWRVGLGG